MKQIMKLLIRFYQTAISPYRPRCCNYIPTCSQYALEAIEKYDITTQGFYITAGYWFNFGWGEKSSVKQKMRPVLRYDFYQKDITAENGASSYYSVGLDWWPEKHLNLHINYTLRNIQKNNKLGHGFNAMLSVKF